MNIELIPLSKLIACPANVRRFKAVADQGKSPEEIAARFGWCSAAIVRQRLKLGNVSPRLIEAYRQEEIELEQLMALAISDDHAAQEKLWSELAGWNRHPSNIRRMLTRAHVEADDPRAQFVGIEVYVAAGGDVLRDLFDEEHQGYLTDPVLLNQLVTRKLEGEAETIRAEGWKWVEIMPGINREALREFSREDPERLPLSEEDQAEIDKLCAECDALLDEHGEDPTEEVRTQIEALSERIDALSEGTERWEPENITRCGAIIGIGHGGRIVVERGLLRPEDAPAEGPPSRPKAGAVAKPKREDGLSDRLVEDLTAHRTAALRAILAGNADVALAAVVHALALPLFYPHRSESCLELDLKGEGLERSAEGIEDSTAAKALAERHEAWLRALPQEVEGLWDWLLVQDTATRLDLLAYCAGCSVNAVKTAQERTDGERFIHADQLAATLDLDMAQWWQPTGASYLSRVPKAKVLEAVCEGVTKGAAENLAKLKKDALVTHAEERLAGTGWLPAVLRRKLPETDAPEIAAAA